MPTQHEIMNYEQHRIADTMLEFVTAILPTLTLAEFNALEAKRPAVYGKYRKLADNILK